ncbi:PREDICTED: telomere repeat-binding protein 6 [Tarenaya hassleriana]|uniref:telomere repeat-binding protein 6 n=1 Tax=Tarenaya hassleriana TaxID=28532 RepID=UPI00053C39A2|nr:PREDICTED: telomere repeat-binding protein 6 [Tarenaya hassleriana]
MLDCGFNGYQLPVVPRACRSPRGRAPITKRSIKNQRDDFEISARVVEKFSDERESKASLDTLSRETEDIEEEEDEREERSPVSNLLEAMEVEVKPIPCVTRERTPNVSLSKDWLALGPSMANCSLKREDCRVEEPTRSEEGDEKKPRTWKSVSGSKIDGKRKMSYPKERVSSNTNSHQESERMYPFKKRKFFHQNHRFESCKNVKFNIKSFKIPDLFVDIPVSATVGTLKATVMEAVTKILNDGLKVGVLLRGKNVGDDSKTLIQTGIRRDDNHGSVGFTLEPPKPGSTTKTLQTRRSVNRRVENTAVSVVPVRIKPISRPETISVQRRIRRPFTVSEVESLVQAVEKLGTGRWRDVKSHAFDDANHRTYVDLKDKWKTLVHTAKISPRQRRGEPVPQELLDRVLTAHAFWSDR